MPFAQDIFGRQSRGAMMIGVQARQTANRRIDASLYDHGQPAGAQNALHLDRRISTMIAFERLLVASEIGSQNQNTFATTLLPQA
jgi:hypothetical protein